MKTHNLATVIGFELRRTLGKPLYWIITLSLPLLMLGLMALSGLSGFAAASTNDDDPSSIKFAYVDPGKHVDQQIATKMQGHLSTDPQGDLAAVQRGELDLLIEYSADPLTATSQLHAKDRGLTKSMVYATIASNLLKQSAQTRINNAQAFDLATKSIPTNLTQYLPDGQVAPGWGDAIAPGVFLILFYLSVIMLGQQMMNITMEEKENRVSEMILTTMNPTTLLVGKITAVIVASLCQMLVLTGLGLGAYLALNTTQVVPPEAVGLLTMPTIKFAPIAIALLLYVGGFLVFTGALVCAGAVMPTAKEAGNVFAFVIVSMFLPVYTWGLIVSDPHGLLSQVLTFFPLTSPITAMLRNALGTLELWETLTTLVILFLTAAGLLALGGKLFRTGTLSYTSRLNIKKTLGFK